TAIVFSEERNNSNLWLWNGRTDETHQLTAETAMDRWASASAAGDQVVFQRARPTLSRLSSYTDADVEIAHIAAGQLAGTRIAVTDAFSPTLAPSGKWLSYARPAKPGQYQLWLKDLQSDHAWHISDQLKGGPKYNFPIERMELNVAWTPSGDGVYFVTGGARQEIQRAIVATGQSVTIVRGEDGVDLHDPRLSADGRSLAYVRRSDDGTGRSDVVIRDLAAGREHIAYTQTHDSRERIFLPGWAEDGRLIVLRASINPDWTERLQAVQVARDGRQIVTSIADRGHGGTARF